MTSNSSEAVSLSLDISEAGTPLPEEAGYPTTPTPLNYCDQSTGHASIHKKETNPFDFFISPKRSSETEAPNVFSRDFEPAQMSLLSLPQNNYCGSSSSNESASFMNKAPCLSASARALSARALPDTSSPMLSTAESRGRSMSDSWQLWTSMSPLFSPWFEHEDSFQSFSPSSRQRTLSSCIASQESRRLVREYDAAKTPTLQQHEQFKHHKWGEDEFCEFDLDTEDIDIDLSIADSIKVFPLTDTVAQCVKSYSEFFGRLTSLPRRQKKRFSELPPLLEDPFLSDSPVSNTTKNSHRSEQPHSPHPFNDSDSFNDAFSVGEIAIPGVVQEGLDFAVMLSRSAGRAIESLINPTCPRRRPRPSNSCPPPDNEPFCPRRRHRRKRKPELKRSSSGSGDEVQWDVLGAITNCPRRASGCPRRERRNDDRFLRFDAVL